MKRVEFGGDPRGSRDRCDRKLIVRRYDSVDELVKGYGSPSEVNRGMWNRYCEETRRGSSWFGVSRDNVIPAIRAGWPTGRKRIAEMVEEFSAKAPRKGRPKRRVHRDRQGDELDIHSVRNGNLDRAWRTTRRVESPRGRTKRITLIYQIGGNCHRNPDELFFSAAAGTILVDRLHTARVALEVFAASGSSGTYTDGTGIFNFVKVKDSAAPLVPGTFAATTLAGFFRMLIFDSIYAEQRRATLGLGSHADLQETMKKYPGIIDFIVPKGTKVIVIPPLFSKSQVTEFINMTLKEFA